MAPLTSAAAIVTGHSRGLGEGIAEQLLDRGVRVLGVSRRRNARLAKRFGKLLEQEKLDLAGDDALLQWIKQGGMRSFFGSGAVPILVNNAGALQPIGPLEKQKASAVSRAVAVNVGAALTLSAAFVAATAKSPDRRLLHISSGAGRKAYAGWSVYCATKAALDHHARAVAMDQTPGLRICSLAPGIIDTEMQAEIRGSTDRLFPDRPRYVELKKEGKLHSPSARGALIAELLLSPDFGREVIAELPR